MQTTKLLSVTGLVAAFLAFAPTRGLSDTEAQIKAREALRQKVSELNTPSAPPPAPAAPAAPPQTVAPVAAPKKAPVFQAIPAPSPAPVPAPAPAPVMAAPGTSKFGPVPAAVDDPNQAQLQAALQRETALFEGVEFAPVPDAVADANAAQAQAALRQEMALLERSSPKPTRPSQTASYVAPLVMEVPPSPLSGPKTARLAELLNRYNANQVTPQEYHIQRAAIIAEP